MKNLIFQFIGLLTCVQCEMWRRPTETRDFIFSFCLLLLLLHQHFTWFVPLDFQTCIASSNSSTDRLCGIILSAKFTRAEEWVHTCKIDSETKSRMIRSSPAKTTTALIKSKLSISQENDDLSQKVHFGFGLAWLSSGRGAVGYMDVFWKIRLKKRVRDLIIIMRALEHIRRRSSSYTRS